MTTFQPGDRVRRDTDVSTSPDFRGIINGGEYTVVGVQEARGVEWLQLAEQTPAIGSIDSHPFDAKNFVLVTPVKTKIVEINIPHEMLQEAHREADEIAEFDTVCCGPRDIRLTGTTWKAQDATAAARSGNNRQISDVRSLTLELGPTTCR